MPHFVHAHATHPDWRAALGLAVTQLQAPMAALGPADRAWQPTLGWLYFSDHYAAHGEALFAAVRERFALVQWVGGVSVGVLANGVEYIDEPALVLMLCDLPDGDFRVFSGAEPLHQSVDRRLGFDASFAQVHADAHSADLTDLIAEMSDRTETGYLYGGLVASRAQGWQIANGLLEGGLSGVAFSQKVAIVSRVTQGCQPVGPSRRITRADRNLILELDGAPALDCLLQDIDAGDADPRLALAKLQKILVGLSTPLPARQGALVSSSGARRRGLFGDDIVVRHLVGFDPPQRGVAVADLVQAGQDASFCTRDTEAARRDLVRICTEIRDELEPESWPRELALTEAADATAPATRHSSRVAGAIYVSCSGRGGPHFGGASAELRIVQRALGDVPLVGFLAAGEIAGHRLFGYTGVLTVFTRDL
jgi:small ligand-binding sensory domain FIST